MDTAQTTTTTQTTDPHAVSTTNPPNKTNNRRRPANRPPPGRQERPAQGGAEHASEGAGTTPGLNPTRGVNSQRGKPPRAPASRSRPNQDGQPEAGSSAPPRNDQRPKKPRPPFKQPRQADAPASGEASTEKSRPASRNSDRPPSSRDKGKDREVNSRRAKFGGTLSAPTPDGEGRGVPQGQAPAKPKFQPPQGDDLVSSLIRGLSAVPYVDCFICFSSIKPDQAIWSCSPALPIIVSSASQDGSAPAVQVQAQYCWTSFHIHCIRSWAEKNVKEVAEAFRARGEPDKKGNWRCPGCQGKREIVPQGYRCFCGSTPEPKRRALSAPHSCGGYCSRPRESGCGHPCPLKCHPGPCPPCQVTAHLKCYCPRQKILTFTCGIDTKENLRSRAQGKGRNLSCGEVCGSQLNCGIHKCDKLCHDGDCGSCAIEEEGRCFCGKETKTVLCGQGGRAECFVEGAEPWTGRYACGQICQRFFDCGVHQCQKPCHVPSSKPPPCPRSPDFVTHCPCGRTTIAPLDQPSLGVFPPRKTCSDPIPTCSSPCGKPHSTCEHPCNVRCHEGPCPPCLEDIIRPCRCGSTTKKLVCSVVYKEDTDGSQAEQEILCEKPCSVLRNCGRHRCNRRCCPLASLATLGQGSKKKKKIAAEAQMAEDQGSWHDCDVVCGKLLNCGQHHCEQKDHQGPCRPCLQSTFEEMVCACGRTTYEPPIPCGTVMECHYPCLRPTTCGHRPTPHSCHPDDVPCAPCFMLTTKLCACGKNEVLHIPCSRDREKVNCGTVCGKLMSCGFHHCGKVCHSGDCGPCTAPCGKSRKSCLPEHHPCSLPCHAPASCPETEPCTAPIVLSCPCGRINQSVPCGRTSSSKPITESSHSATPKCTSECEIAKRNARLAEALGINPSHKSHIAGPVVYSDGLLQVGQANPKFVATVEAAFKEFVESGKNERVRVLPQMPHSKRQFVMELAGVYRMDTVLVDQEPHRSIQLVRRIDTRIPTPLLSASLGGNGSGTGTGSGSAGGSGSTGLGRLVDSKLRTGGAWNRQTQSPSSGLSGGAGTSALGSTSAWGRSAPTSKPATPNPIMGRGWTPVPVTTATIQTTASRPESPVPVNAAVLVRPVSTTTAATMTTTATATTTTVAADGSSGVEVPQSWEDDV